ncbi:MAG: M20/M25/M40 family metallo-hydrolase [Acidobacteriota bacterium]|nr:M20/M25/M40 family metallo-hydrolase [Acidobacteriota bacterium]
MKLTNLKKTAFALILLLTITGTGLAQKNGKNGLVAERNVRAQMEFLASDAMQGRGSGTQFELLAGLFIASQLQQFGVEPAGDADASGNKTYIQTVNITRSSFAAAPKLSYSANGSNVVLEHGKEMIVLRISAPQISGNLQKINVDEKPQAGSIAFVRLREGDAAQNLNQKLQTISAGGAKAVIVEETPQWRTQWENIAKRSLSFTTITGSAGNPFNLIVIGKDAANALSQIVDGTNIEIKGELAAPQSQQTWNAVGKLTGSDARLGSEVVLLSAHMDHVGVRQNAPGDDKIFNGADDDASGCVAVLELSRLLASGKQPKRTVYFAFFGSEEAGGYGSRFFVDTLPFPKEKLIANLQFEMIGRPDPKVAAEELWLTGYDRSNLGAELAKQGAKLVADPHPEQNFFQRSDNYTLARQGIVAHTVSSFGLHTDYHRASDELKTIDFKHMTQAINSMVKPVQWLVNSDFKPVWHEGKKP